MKKEDLLYVLHRIEIDNTKKMLNSDAIRSCEVNGSNVSIIIAVSNPSLQFKNKLQQTSKKNNEKSILGLSRAPLNASLLNLITKMVPKDHTPMSKHGPLVTLNLGTTLKL